MFVTQTLVLSYRLSCENAWKLFIVCDFVLSGEDMKFNSQQQMLFDFYFNEQICYWILKSVVPNEARWNDDGRLL